MIVLVQAKVLTVGLNGKNEVLRELPIQLIEMQSGVAAARSLKNEKIDSVISSWNLEDMKDGWFLKRLKAVKPGIPTIVFVEAGNAEQEVEARCIGASAVLTDDTDDEYFKRTIVNVLGLKELVRIESIGPVRNRKYRRKAKSRRKVGVTARRKGNAERS